MPEYKIELTRPIRMLHRDEPVPLGGVSEAMMRCAHAAAVLRGEAEHVPQTKALDSEAAIVDALLEATKQNVPMTIGDVLLEGLTHGGAVDAKTGKVKDPMNRDERKRRNRLIDKIERFDVLIVKEEDTLDYLLGLCEDRYKELPGIGQIILARLAAEIDRALECPDAGENQTPLEE